MLSYKVIEQITVAVEITIHIGLEIIVRIWYRLSSIVALYTLVTFCVGDD